jgi:hypothetical protein
LAEGQVTERRQILLECPTQTEQSLKSRAAAALTSDMPFGDLEILIGEVETASAAFDAAAPTGARDLPVRVSFEQKRIRPGIGEPGRRKGFCFY